MPIKVRETLAHFKTHRRLGRRNGGRRVSGPKDETNRNEKKEREKKTTTGEGK